MSEAQRHDDVTDTTVLDRLCAHFGIASHYHDIWGKRHRVSADSLLALLAEFDLKPQNPAEQQQALTMVLREAWQQALPPVLAIEAAAPLWRLSLRLPAGTGRLRWKLRDETGALHTGEFDAQTLPELSRTDVDGQILCERTLLLTQRLPAGYHQFSVDDLAGSTLIISAPAHCYRPAALLGKGKVWGASVQLYALRSKRNWGMGDFTDLAQLVSLMAEQGADVIGLNPLHALFPHNPAHASPYSPSSRQQLNVLYIDVEAIPDFADCEPVQQLVRTPDFQQRLSSLREAELVDHAGVAAAKFEALELLFTCFRERHLTPDAQQARDASGREFLDYVEAGGEALLRHALFEALQAHFHAQDAAVWGWQVWPQDYRHPDHEAVQDFALQHADRVQFHLYLQWLATRQLAVAADRCRALGMNVGLYLDLAVSVDRAGSDVWCEQSTFAQSASVGAPPDEFNPQGQGWGLPPLRPDRLRASHYSFLIETLRSNMRGAGALRIDHVMGLMRLFWIPPGKTPREGTYVHYPLEEMLSIVALESQRNRCMVIGEDLGTVADEMRAALTRFDVLSYRLLYFERDAQGEFKPPADYPANALVSISTHDLSPLAGWWSGQDLHLRLQLGLFPDQQLFEKQLVDRAQERIRLLLALQREGLLSAQEFAEASGKESLSPSTVNAIHAYLGATPSALMIVHLEEVLGVTAQVNMPGTTHQQPNWQRKLPVDLSALASRDELLAIGRTLSALRPRAAHLPQLDASTQAKVPRATYRLQLHKDFGFDDACRVLPYLVRLGISHVYCSPIQRARAGSMHGYDVVAHDQINPELGGSDGFARFSSALREHDLGLLLDMVPNHMGVLGGDNAWWMDVLENGQASRYAQHFDIDWQPLNPELCGKVLLPVLGDHYGDVLTRGELVLQFDAENGSLALSYFDHRFPLAPESYPTLLARALTRIADEDVAAGLASLSTAFGHLPSRDSQESDQIAERARDKELLKTRLARLVSRLPEVGHAITTSVAELNLAGAHEELHALIETQAYRLAYWRVAADEINYRRFFDINELAALRMEREEVFEATQGFALELAARGDVSGLRIDHPDGLYDPAQYFAQLQQSYIKRAGLILPEKDAQGRPVCPLYVVAEKIAALHEEVPTSWSIHGTTGYRFANLVNGLLVDASSATKFSNIWRNFTGIVQGFDELARDGKRDIMRTALGSELNVLSTELLRIARADRRTRDYTHNALRRALTEIVACMPVYRTYIIDAASPQDLRYVDWAVNDAEQLSLDADLSVFDFVRQTLLGQAISEAPDALRARVRRFAIRFQQFSAPVAAKGVEDTAFYRYFPLSSLNEVGGEPSRFGITVAEFHEASLFRAQHWPHTMLATSTHDNKRSEDVRNRIDVLSEMPAAWRLALRRWHKLNSSLRTELQLRGNPFEAPSRADEYLLYQTLLGTLPAGGLSPSSLPDYRERMLAYMLKAAREAKVHTRWTQPNAAYEAAIEHFVRGLLARVEDNPFLEQLHTLGASLSWFGALNGLSATLIKLTSPGVPDLYQGHERINLSLVDPDNRQAVDYEALGQDLSSLESLEAAALPDLVQAAQDGRAKIWLNWRLLTLRREHPALFRDGDYAALDVQGSHAEHVVAFARSHQGCMLIAIAGRHFARLLGESLEPPLGEAAWLDTAVAVGLPDGARLTHVLTGESLTVSNGLVTLGNAFSRFPAAAFISSPE